MEELLEHLKNSFNNKAETDPRFRQSVAGFDKTIAFSLTDDADYYFFIHNGNVPSIQRGKPAHADIKIITDKQNLIAVLSGQTDPMKAMLTRKLKVNGSLQDVAFMKRFIDQNKTEIAGLVNSRK